MEGWVGLSTMSVNNLLKVIAWKRSSESQVRDLTTAPPSHPVLYVFSSLTLDFVHVYCRISIAPHVCKFYFVLYRACSGVQNWKSVRCSAASRFSWHAWASGFIPRFHTTCRLVTIQAEHISTSQRVAVDVGTPAASCDWYLRPTAVWRWYCWTSKCKYQW